MNVLCSGTNIRTTTNISTVYFKQDSRPQTEGQPANLSFAQYQKVCSPFLSPFLFPNHHLPSRTEYSLSLQNTHSIELLSAYQLDPINEVSTRLFCRQKGMNIDSWFESKKLVKIGSIGMVRTVPGRVQRNLIGAQFSKFAKDSLSFY